MRDLKPEPVTMSGWAPPDRVRVGLKARFTAFTDRAGLNDLALRLGSGRHPLGYVRVVNLHGTPAVDADRFAEVIEWLLRRFQPVGSAEFCDVLAGSTRLGRPGIVFTFDDGLRSNYDVAAPILESFGLQGWFFIPSGFVDCPPDAQLEYSKQHRIRVRERYPDGRIAMSWDEVRDLSTRHEIGSHTVSHRRFLQDLSAGELDTELRASKARLEAQVGRPVDSFCWVGGETASYRRDAADMIRDAGYRYSFCTCAGAVTACTHPHMIGRSNIESDLPVSQVGFQVSPLNDLYYRRKFRQVESMLGLRR